MEPKKMTSQQVVEWLRSARHLMGDELADMMEAHLLALESVPEDVARDVARVMKTLEAEGQSIDDCCDRCHYRAMDTAAVQSVNVLATAAARVPGLEAKVAELETCAADVKAEFDRGEWVTSAGYREQVERLRVAESERDAARQESAAFLLEVNALQPRVATLTARVAELDARCTALDVGCFNCGGLPHTDTCKVRDTKALLRRAEQAEARATAAEAKVAQYEEAARDLDAHFDLRQLWAVGDLGVEDPSGINGVFAKFRGLLGMEGETYESTRTVEPTPAPGLREAVEMARRAAGVLQDWSRSEGPHGGFQGDVAVAFGRLQNMLEAIQDIAAYDGTAPGETEAKAARRMRQVAAALTRAGVPPRVVVLNCEERHGRRRDTLHRVLWLIEGWESLRREVTAMRNDDARAVHRQDQNAEKAAKWDAAVERAKDEVRLQSSWYGLNVKVDIVERALSYVLSLSLSTAPGGAVTQCQHSETFWEASAPCGICGADPETPPERDAEVRDMERTDYKAPPVTEDMSLPPTAPGGEETSSHVTGENGDCDPWCRACRARIAPTPTPEGPALAQPEPAAPEVAWERNGFKVFASGSWSDPDGDDDERVGILARALAEAKRSESEALSSASARREVLAEAKRKAAEDMRERAAKRLDEMQQQDPWMNYDAAQKALQSAAASIRALPVEAP